MKAVKIINIALQGLSILGTIFSVIFIYFENQTNGYSVSHLEQDFILIGGIGGIGCIYQIIHAFVISILKLVNKKFNWLFGTYWILVLVYILGWLVALFVPNLINLNDPALLRGISLGWIPVIYYFTISIIDLTRMQKK